MNEIKKNSEIRIQNAPVIFHVRSSFANFFRSIFSSFSGLRSGDAFPGFSGGLLGDVFFSLLAMKTKIINSKSQGAEISSICMAVISEIFFLLTRYLRLSIYPQSSIAGTIKTTSYILLLLQVFRRRNLSYCYERKIYRYLNLNIYFVSHIVVF